MAKGNPDQVLSYGILTVYGWKFPARELDTPLSSHPLCRCPKNHRPNCRIRRCFWLCAKVSYVAGPQQMGVALPRKHAYAPSPSHPLIKFTFHCCSLDGGRPVAHLVAFVGFRLSVALIFAFGSRRSLLLGPISIAIPSASPNPNSNPPKFGSCVD